MLGDGFCIKEACSQSYATDAKAIGILRQLCDQNKIAYQRFVNRSDVRGGGTLGSVASTLFPGPHSGYWNSALIDAFCTGTDGTNGF